MEVAEANPEEWAIGFQDECWWSRVALPTLSSFSEEKKPDRMIQRSVAKDDPEPKAISCYGLYPPEIDETWLRFVDGAGARERHNEPVFLEWCCERLEGIGKKVVVLIRDNNASWHISEEVRRWLARKTRSPSQGERRRGEDRGLSSARAESVARRDRARAGTRQAQGRRTRGPFWEHTSLPRGYAGFFRLSALRASVRSPEGRLIMH